MTIDDKIRDEKLRYEINTEAAKISAKTLDTPYKYEYLTGEEIIPSDQKQLIEQIKFQYGPLGKALEKQTKTIEDQGGKQFKAIEEHSKQLLKSNEVQTIKDIIPEDKMNEDAKNELNEIIEIEKTIDRKKLTYKTKKNHIALKTLQQ